MSIFTKEELMKIANENSQTGLNSWISFTIAFPKNEFVNAMMTAMENGHYDGSVKADYFMAVLNQNMKDLIEKSFFEQPTMVTRFNKRCSENTGAVFYDYKIKPFRMDESDFKDIVVRYLKDSEYYPEYWIQRLALTDFRFDGENCTVQGNVDCDVKIKELYYALEDGNYDNLDDIEQELFKRAELNQSDIRDYRNEFDREKDEDLGR